MRHREHRFVSDRLVRIARGQAVENARLANISATGARLRGPTALRPGERVKLCQRDVQIPAEVVWSEGQETGLVFLTALTPAQLQAMSGMLGRPAGPTRTSWGNHGFRELK